MGSIIIITPLVPSCSFALTHGGRRLSLYYRGLLRSGNRLVQRVWSYKTASEYPFRGVCSCATARPPEAIKLMAYDPITGEQVWADNGSLDATNIKKLPRVPFLSSRNWFSVSNGVLARCTVHYGYHLLVSKGIQANCWERSRDHRDKHAPFTNCVLRGIN